MPKEKTKAKPALNIRDFPADLMARLKADAAKAGGPLREHVIQILGTRWPVTTAPAVFGGAAADASEIVPLTTASQLATDKDGDHPGPATHRCPRCGAVLIPWGPGQRRCRTCATNFPAG